MSSPFCCNDIAPHSDRRLDHQAKFDDFMKWASTATSAATGTPGSGTDLNATTPYAVQLVRQINFGPLESKRYFFMPKGENKFVEIKEGDLIAANFKMLNAYKNFKCNTHNKFFEINLYQKDPVNKHHWRADIARPASSIDL